MESAGVQRKVLDLGFEDEKGPGDTFSSAPALQVLLSSLEDRSEHCTHNCKSCAGEFCGRLLFRGPPGLWSQLNLLQLLVPSL